MLQEVCYHCMRSSFERDRSASQTRLIRGLDCGYWGTNEKLLLLASFALRWPGKFLFARLPFAGSSSFVGLFRFLTSTLDNYRPPRSFVLL